MAAGHGLSEHIRGPARPALLFVASRVVVVAALVFASAVSKDLPLRETFRKWDGGYYLAVAEHGYPDSVPESRDGRARQSVIAFLPLYPALIAGAHLATGAGMLESALAVGAVAGLIATLLLWMLVRMLSGARAADRATALFCFFPGAFTWSLVYSEPVMLALVLGCLIALLRRRWITAGLLAAFATASRPNALVLVACCAAAAFAAVRERGEWRSLIAPAIAPAGFASFICFLAWRTGEWSAWWRVQREGWGERLDLGGETVARISRVAHQRPWGDRMEINAVLATLGLLLTIVLADSVRRWRPPFVLWVWTGGIVVLSLTAETLGMRPRFIHTAFPLLAGAGVGLRGRWLALAVAFCAAGSFGLAFLSVTTLHAVP